jgi:hypothetical protein
MVPRNEKVDILTPALFVQPPRPRLSKWRHLGLAALLASVLTVVLRYVDLNTGLVLSTIRPGHRIRTNLCPQSDVLYPKQHADIWKSLGHDFGEKTFTGRAVAWLGGAVRIPYV